MLLSFYYYSYIQIYSTLPILEYLYIYIHIYTYTSIHIFMCIFHNIAIICVYHIASYIYFLMFTYYHTQISLFLSLGTYSHMYVHILQYIHAYNSRLSMYMHIHIMYNHIHMCTFNYCCVYIYICIHAYDTT